MGLMRLATLDVVEQITAWRIKYTLPQMLMVGDKPKIVDCPFKYQAGRLFSLHICLPACLLACLPACLLACLPACLRACVPVEHPIWHAPIWLNAYRTPSVFQHLTLSEVDAMVASGGGAFNDIVAPRALP